MAQGMVSGFCNRCGDAIEKGCDPRDELVELDALLERLKLKRYDLKRKINRFHSSIVRQLPPDVMSTVFEFCLPDFMDHQLLASSPYDKGNNCTPLSLGAICSYWRDIALSTPSLWSSLVVCDPSEHNSYIVTGLAQEWLARSGRLPLSIRILSTSYNKTVSALIGIINDYSTRWSDLDLCMPNGYYELFHASDNQTAIHAPILKSIQFHSLSNHTRKMNFRLNCPPLERASLSYPLDGFNIQWESLTHLTLISMSIIEPILLLCKTPRLVFLHVSGYCFRRRIEEQNIAAPVVTSLRSLHLLIDNSATEVFLNNLTAPHLEEFCLPRGYIPKIEVVTSFLRRSTCSLRSLSIRILPNYHERLMNILQSMPSLTTLSIKSVTSFKFSSRSKYRPQNISQLVVKVLSSQSTSIQQGFLPNLRIFTKSQDFGIYRRAVSSFKKL